MEAPFPNFFATNAAVELFLVVDSLCSFLAGFFRSFCSFVISFFSSFSRFVISFFCSLSGFVDRFLYRVSRLFNFFSNCRFSFGFFVRLRATSQQNRRRRTYHQCARKPRQHFFAFVFQIRHFLPRSDLMDALTHPETQIRDFATFADRSKLYHIATRK